MTTLYAASPVVNPVHAQLGAAKLDLYDWLRLRTRPGRTRRVEELAPPGTPRYEQLAERLRTRIFDGTWPDDASGPTFGAAYGVSPPVVQRAFEILEREGLLRLESGKRTSVVGRRRWRLEVEAPLPGSFGPAEAEAEAARVKAAVDGAGHAAISGASALWIGARLVVVVTVESAHLPGAVTAGLPVVRRALAPLEIEKQAAGPA
jgi:DNA-binding transcriptional regulator YhcF (GntR family)